MATDADLVGLSWVLWLDRCNEGRGIERTTKDVFNNILRKGARHAARRDLLVEVVENSVCMLKK